MSDGPALGAEAFSEKKRKSIRRLSDTRDRAAPGLPGDPDDGRGWRLTPGAGRAGAPGDR
ncbi:MAG: hypothetical protein ACOY4I_05900 [Bacillota bacterium]